VLCEHEDTHDDLQALIEQSATAQPERHGHEHDGRHDHSHGWVDRSILRSRAGIRAVSWSLEILAITALAQAFIYSRTLSVALLADLSRQARRGEAVFRKRRVRPLHRPSWSSARLT
jgi:hypothetical protein